MVNEWVPKPQSHYITIDDQGSNTYDEMIAASSCSGGSTLRAPDEQLPKPMVAKYVNGSVQRFYWNISTQQLTHYETVDGPNVPSVEATEVLYTKEITFRGGRVEFEIGNRVSSSGSTIYDNIKRLNKILVYDDKNNILKEIRLSYQEETSYSNVPNNSNSIYQSRMLLQSVETFANNVTVGERYEFTYDTERKLPNKFSYDLDLWGYYNGQKNNLSLVPVTMLEAKTYTNASVNLSLGDADRSSDPYYNYGQAAILTKIKYPTGGTTTFEYEPNKALDIQTNQLTIVGGFRIRKISEYDPASFTTRVRGFKYGTNESGGGYMRHWVTSAGLYDPFLTQQNKIALVNTLVVCGFPLTGYTYNAIQISSRYRTLMSNPVSSLFYNGEVVSYPEVSEYNGDAYQENAGKTVHNFTFSGMGSLGGYETPFFINGTTLPYETKGEWVYGVANKINVFNSQSIANYNLVKHNGYGYLANFDPDKIWSRSVFKSTLILDQFNGLAIYPYYYQTQINEYQTGYNQLLSDTVVVIENNTPAIHKIVNYTYGNSNLTTPTETSFINSAGRLIREKSMFPHQIVAVGNSQPYQEMINRNMINIPIRSEKYMDQTMIERKTTDFQEWNNGIIAPSKISVEKGGFIAEDRVQFEDYDKYGNLEQYRLAHAVSSSIKYGYKDQHPTAEIKNALLNEVYHQNLEEPELGLDFEANLIYDNSRSHTGVYSGRLSNSGSSEMVSMSSKRININLTAPKKYTYSGWVYSNGPTADIHLFMLKAGANEYYSYVDAASTGVTNKWVYIEKDFLVPGDVATLHLRVDNNSAGDVWFDDLNIRPSEATITTYTYKPLVGMTSMIDAKGMTIYYEYDSFGRLKFIRDQDGNFIKQTGYHYKN